MTLGTGTWRFVHIAGRAVPGIQIGEPQRVMVTTTQGRQLPAVFADILTLRTTNPVGPDGEPQEVSTYLTVTPENLRFTTLRFGDPIVGLDVDENGAQLSLEALEAIRAKDIEARQLARQQAMAPTIVSLD